MQLDMAGGRLGLSELASTVVLSPSGLSKLLDRMEAASLLRREPDPRDARSTFAQITPRGRSVVRKARESHHAWVQQVFGDALDDRDVADLTRIMARIDAATPHP
jgi:DNA-binding MarR family transcriptional regulator